MEALNQTIQKFRMRHGVMIIFGVFLFLFLLSKTTVDVFSIPAKGVLTFLSNHFGYFLCFYFLFGLHCLYYCMSFVKKLERKVKLNHENFEKALQTMLGIFHLLFCFTGVALMAWITSPYVLSHLHLA